MVKVYQLLELNPALQLLSSVKLPVKAAYRIGRALNQIRGELNQYEEHRMKLMQEFGTLNEAKTEYVFGDKLGEFTEQMKLLLEEDVDITFHTISLAEMGEINIEARYLSALMGIILTE